MVTLPKKRVRFAPSPTGRMHLGNIRSLFFNYLFAKKYSSDFILRIEDTDPKRTFDPGAKHILSDLAWLNIDYTYGPEKSGPDAPYFQSKRTAIYQTYLQQLKKENLIYQCFCCQETLEKKRKLQIQTKQPPRYDRFCLEVLSEQEKLQAKKEKKPFIWRIKLDRKNSVEVTDFNKNITIFHLKHFSDFPLTRTDGSVTFIFANAIDDIEMNITHVLRGEDHLSNTANQMVLFNAFSAKPPFYWHMPIICNATGKKLSKRDHGFSLNDLKNDGYLPEAICNYLFVIAQQSFKHEIMSIQEMVAHVNFLLYKSGGTVKFDLKKLSWINQKWIARLQIATLGKRSLPFVASVYPGVKIISKEKYHTLLHAIRPEVSTLLEIPNALAFYFKPPKYDQMLFETCIARNVLAKVIRLFANQPLTPATLPILKTKAAKENLIKPFFTFLRLALTGSARGIGIGELLTLIEQEKIDQRMKIALSLFSSEIEKRFVYDK